MRREPRSEERAPRLLQALVMLLGSVAVATFAVAVADGSFRRTDAAWLTFQLSAMVLGGWGMRRLSHRWFTPPSVSPVLVLLGLFPFVQEIVLRSGWGTGRPFEILTMSVLRNLVIGLAVLSCWRRFHPLALSLALFLVLFGVIATGDFAARALAGIFAAGAVGWLAAAHWLDVRQRLDTRQTELRPRWRAAVLLPLLLVAVGLVRLSGGDRVLRQGTQGWLASSGGSGQRDPHSRDGIGDGEMLVAGSERVQSFAPIENAPFVSDDQPSLYDVFDDTYQEPVRPPQTQDRAVGLPPDLASRVKEHLHAQTEKASREFSTRRESPPPGRNRPIDSIASDALFYVAGRVPLHLRLQTFDLFDGVDWYPEAESTVRPPLHVNASSGTPWLDLPDREKLRPYLAAAESHALKIVRLQTNVIPAPLYLHGVHIDRVEQADMFAWGPDGLVRMARKELPRLVPIHLAERAIDTSRIGAEVSVYSTLGGAFRSIPPIVDQSRLRQLARSWTFGIDRGWPQIDAIRRRLQTECHLDPDARPASEAPCPTEDFLFHSHRGPDYQFATAAALLLRSLGYSTRIVSGFYADPRKYDAASQHTPVHAADVHFWTEIHVGGSDWLPVEASPGYELLAPPPTFWQRTGEFLTRCVTTVQDRWIAVAGTGLLLLVTVWQRSRLADLFDTLLWRLTQRPGAGSARQVLATFRLLERRSARVGNSRPTGMTPHRWLTLLSAAHSPSAADLERFRRWIDEAAFSPDGLAAPSTEVHEVGSRVEKNLSQPWFRQRSRVPSEPRSLTP